MRLAQMGRSKGRQVHPSGKKATLTTEDRAHVRGLREGREWTQRELADRAGVTQGTISNLESGDGQPYLSVYKKILSVLKATPSPGENYYGRIVDGASELSESDQRTVALFIDTLKKSRES